MKFSEAPNIAEWVTVLADEGWKITKLDPNQFAAEKVIGNVAKYPVRQEIRWYIDVEDVGNGVIVSLEVPIFADSPFSRHRLLEQIDDITTIIDGYCEFESDVESNLLEGLRRR